MRNVILHPKTSALLTEWYKNPPQSVLLVGPKGSGKASVGLLLTTKLLGITDEKLANYAYFRHITPTKSGSIAIETVRELQQFLNLKVPSAQSIQRVVLLEDAHLLSTEAQNAFLKTLEEPPAGTVLILTTSHSDALLQTIRSRVQMLHILKPQSEMLRAHFVAQYPPEEVKRVDLLSGGLPGLMQALLDGDTEHPLFIATEQARNILKANRFERLTMVDALQKQKELARNVLFALQQMARAALRTSQGEAAERWSRILQTSFEAESQLDNNAQPKLVLTNLMLNL